jgi:hypothetical protein
MPPAGRWLLSPGCPGIPPSNGDRPECASQSSISSQPRPVTHVNRVSRAEGRTDSLYHPYYNVKRLKTLVSRPVRALARPWRPHPPTWIIHQPFVWLLGRHLAATSHPFDRRRNLVCLAHQNRHLYHNDVSTMMKCILDCIHVVMNF